MHEAIARMLSKYKCEGLNDYINALREIVYLQPCCSSEGRSSLTMTGFDLTSIYFSMSS